MSEKGQLFCCPRWSTGANATGFRKHSFPSPVLLFLVFQGSRDGFRELASKVLDHPVVLRISSFLWNTVIITYPDLLLKRQLGRATMTGKYQYQYILFVSCIFHYVRRITYIKNTHYIHTYFVTAPYVRGPTPAFLSLFLPISIETASFFGLHQCLFVPVLFLSLDSCHGFPSFKYIFPHFSYSRLPHCFLLSSSHRIYMTFSRNIPPSSPSVA